MVQGDNVLTPCLYPQNPLSRGAEHLGQPRARTPSSSSSPWSESTSNAHCLVCFFLAGGCRWSLVEGFGQTGGAHPQGPILVPAPCMGSFQLSTCWDYAAICLIETVLGTKGWCLCPPGMFGTTPCITWGCTL